MTVDELIAILNSQECVLRYWGIGGRGYACQIETKVGKKWRTSIMLRGLGESWRGALDDALEQLTVLELARDDLKNSG